VSIQIGRFVGDTVQRIERSGNDLRVSGINESASQDAREAEMQQFSGLVDNNDETVVPVVTADRPDLDGFWKTSRAQITELPRVTETAWIWQWSINLERVGGGFAQPFFEQVAIGVHRAGGTAIGLQFAIHDGVLSSSGAGTEYTRVSEDGNVFVYGSTATSSGSSSLVRFSTAPSTYYESAVKIEVQYGATWYPLVGRQIPSPSDIIGAWRLTNGLVRVFPSATLGALDFEVYDPQGAAWVSVATFKHGYNDTFGDVKEQGIGVNTSTDGSGDPQFDAETAPAVIRNGPDLVAIQFDTLGWGMHTLSLRQGAYHVELNPGNSSARAVWLASSTACSNTDDSGIVATSADGNGNRVIICAADVGANLNTDLTNGVLETDNPSIPFGMGVCVNNAASLDFNGYDDVVDQFLATFSMRREVVGR